MRVGKGVRGKGKERQSELGCGSGRVIGEVRGFDGG